MPWRRDIDYSRLSTHHGIARRQHRLFWRVLSVPQGEHPQSRATGLWVGIPPLGLMSRHIILVKHPVTRAKGRSGSSGVVLAVGDIITVDSFGGITEEIEKASCLPIADFASNELENTVETRRVSL